MQMLVLIGVVMTLAYGPLPEMHIVGPTARSMWGWRDLTHHELSPVSPSLLWEKWMVCWEATRKRSVSHTGWVSEALQESPSIKQTRTAKPKTRAHLQEDTFESTVLTPSQMIPESRDRARRIYHDPYIDIFTDQQISIELNTKDFETSSKSVKEEVERMHFWKANTSYLLFRKGFLLFWCCVIHLSLTAPSCVKFTQALKDCGIPKEIIFQSIEFLMEKPPWMLSYKLEDPLLSK